MSAQEFLQLSQNMALKLIGGGGGSDALSHAHETIRISFVQNEKFPLITGDR